MAACENFARIIGENSAVPISINNSIEAACRDADVLVTVTDADGALVKENGLSPAPLYLPKVLIKNLMKHWYFNQNCMLTILTRICTGRVSQILPRWQAD